MGMYERSYLNAEEQKEVLVLSAFFTYFQDNIDKWTEHRNTKFMKIARTTKTYVQKLINVYFENKDEEQIKICKKRCISESVYTKSNAQAQSEYDKAVDKHKNITIDREEFEEICEQGITICQTCKCDRKFADGCNFRKLMLKYDIPPANWEQDAACPYKYLVDEEGGE